MKNEKAASELAYNLLDEIRLLTVRNDVEREKRLELIDQVCTVTRSPQDKRNKERLMKIQTDIRFLLKSEMHPPQSRMLIEDFCQEDAEAIVDGDFIIQLGHSALIIPHGTHVRKKNPKSTAMSLVLLLDTDIMLCIHPSDFPEDGFPVQTPPKDE